MLTLDSLFNRETKLFLEFFGSSAAEKRNVVCSSGSKSEARSTGSQSINAYSAR
jgi:hypothetical protein